MSVKFNLTCVKVSAVLIFLLFFQLVQAQPDFTEIDRKFEASRKELGGNAVMLIYKDGKIIYQKISGEFNAKSQAPIASCSKWLTAALIMTFVDQGKLSLDDKVSKYIPIFGKYSKGFITIKDCIANLSGIETETSKTLPFFGKKKYASLEEEVNEFASKKEIQSNPGLEFRFSNIGFDIAGRVLEVITKRGFEQIMQEHLTRPLAMRNTSFSSFNAVDPSGGALSTASDFMNFLSMFLNKGMFNGKRVLSEKAISEMCLVRTTPSMIKFTPKVTEGYNYGLGAWIMESDENGNGTVLTAPGFSGTWPMIDNCRGYACIFFTKGTLSEEKKEIYLDIKKMIDDQLKSNCK